MEPTEHNRRAWDEIHRRRAEALAAVLAGEPEGTRFAAGEARYSSFKLWLKYAKPAQGTLCVDAGAARALREGGTSLLPVGIVEVRGSFDYRMGWYVIVGTIPVGIVGILGTQVGGGNCHRGSIGPGGVGEDRMALAPGTPVEDVVDAGAERIASSVADRCLLPSGIWAE